MEALGIGASVVIFAFVDAAIDCFVGFWRKIDSASTVSRVKTGSVLSRKKNISAAN
jgi:hypothetical protein